MAGRSWRVEGYDGNERFLEKELPGNLGDNEIIRLLQRLACKNLTHDEILAASLRPKARNYVALLEPEIDDNPSNRYSIRLGTNPHYVASKERLNAPRT
jgi:hypothetical protein